MSNIFNCPSCAAELDKKIKYSKHIICKYCYSSIFLDDDSVKNLGKMAQLIDEPSIFTMGKYFEYRDWKFIPIGRVRYDYGRGWWDEWYVTDSSGETKWISVDEGNIAIEKKTNENENPIISFDDLSIGESLTLTLEKKSYTFSIIEKKRCKCVAAEGELPFEIIPNEEFNYVDLLANGGTAATIEMFDDGTQDIFLGSWIDSFDIKGCY